MINFTPRLDRAIRIAARSHEKQQQHRKGGDIPYIVHPFSVMAIASSVADDEDTLIACLFHDILEDVAPKIYDAEKMKAEFGEKVLAIVKDVTNNARIKDWKDRSNAYLYVLESKASPEALIVSCADKTHNLLATIEDHKEIGDEIWKRFSTGSKADQIWWYKANLEIFKRRNAPKILVEKLDDLIEALVKLK